MGKMRKPFQGVWNIIRFNWHYYLLSGIICVCLWLVSRESEGLLQEVAVLILFIMIIVNIVSLLVSLYVYDISGLYTLNWIPEPVAGAKILNVNAGFDDTSKLLAKKFPRSELIVLDFYDAAKHTEISIKRARRAYPPYPGTLKTNTSQIALESSSIDMVFAIFSAHEIRDTEERVIFFRELTRILKPGGRLMLVEHLRNKWNFAAYNIGFFHFHSRAVWKTTFSASGLRLVREKKITPFITIFSLEKNGDTP